VGLTAIAGLLLPKLLGGFSIFSWIQGILKAALRERWGFVTRNWREFVAWVWNLPFEWQFWAWIIAFVVALVVLICAAYYNQNGENNRQ
jgi:ABC-type antimicrobial peptide transport system permease subunit